MIQIEIDDAPVLAALNRLLERGENMAPAMSAIADALLSQSERNFAAQSGPLGPWPALKDKKRAGGKILQDSGHLAASVTAHHGADFASVDSNVEYAAIHQLGGDIHKAAQSRQVRHRTDAKGNLLRSGQLGGKGLIFAKNSHKSAIARWFEQDAHDVHIPARPYMPVYPDGRLQQEAQNSILDILNDYLAKQIG